MIRIILIETSTAMTSVALAEDGKITAYKESSEMREQAALTAPFIKEILDGKGLTVKDCTAVCVSKGPGSYTGLRVGVSTAKGLCFGAGIGLLSVGTLDTLVWQAIDGNLLPEGCKYIVPMIDARRMEVYTSVFTPDGKQITETEPKVIDPESFCKELQEGPVLFIGDGAAKCSEILKSGNAFFCNCNPKASSMLKPALAMLDEKRFEDVAYFEPFYLKQFIPTVSRHKVF
ncbi:MAG: tRNA (adenosine(37)-N6)-threonylcarbamoyltransferase complex dimerization subunit type 1 TsaB [Bacteroidales bacterium]|jgi:tRNA threonylcarbamoyladenosine biosynthesis protein TsaB|nr:tRNA (adenosine(37)-N6)-threonylcarbamoyltransferase complex dimerization subunit type 1 TsaB [Bacteroidales bacterium]MCI1784568.1 tRNA (adenosine(37)-N6)-threonylcarbamoyltransferase complex dimerization subunit type 1 TsaB [Bacteroidales bacterium]